MIRQKGLSILYLMKQLNLNFAFLFFLYNHQIYRITI